MIWARVELDGEPAFGILEGEDLAITEGSPFGNWKPTGQSVPIADAKLLPPTEPRTFFCVGMNYRAHIAHAQARGNKSAVVPERPEVGYRANNALIAHREAIVVPPDLEGPLEAEPEVVAVIGRPLRNASRDEAAAGIFGWTLGNDVSARAWQRADRTFWRAKNADTFKPMGPWIVTGADPASATTTLRINGEATLTFATGDMIFDAVDFIVEITRYITMSPGDVLWMGADGTAEMAPGDLVEVDVSGIGRLINPVVATRAQ